MVGFIGMNFGGGCEPCSETPCSDTPCGTLTTIEASWQAPTGRTMRVALDDLCGNRWNGSAWEALNPGNMSAYLLTLTESPPGTYSATITIPATSQTIASHFYNIVDEVPIASGSSYHYPECPAPTCGASSPIDEMLLEAATGPRMATVDGVTVQQHSLAEQIAFAKYAKAQARTKPQMKFTRILPPSSC